VSDRKMFIGSLKIDDRVSPTSHLGYNCVTFILWQSKVNRLVTMHESALQKLYRTVTTYQQYCSTIHVKHLTARGFDVLKNV